MVWMNDWFSQTYVFLRGKRCALTREDANSICFKIYRKILIGDNRL